MTKSLGIFIFTYNEDPQVLGRLVAQVRSNVPEAAVIILDDGSKKDLYGELEKSADGYIRHHGNLGIGFARNTAFKVAARKGFEQCVFLDGDGQHDPASIASLLSSGSDITIGSRFLHSDNAESTSGIRVVGIGIIRWLIWRLFRLKITDPTSGLRKYSRKAISILSGLEPYEYPEALEISDASRYGLSVTEIQVEMKPRMSGKSTIGFLKSLYYMFDISVTLVLNQIQSFQKK